MGPLMLLRKLKCPDKEVRAIVLGLSNSPSSVFSKSLNVLLSRNASSVSTKMKLNSNMAKRPGMMLLSPIRRLLQDRHFSIKRQNSKAYKSELSDDLKMVLSSIGSSKEVQYWLKHYGSSGKKEIAVIKIGGAILRDEELLKTLVNSVSFLQKAGLSPVIIHGAGPQLIDALADQNIVSDYVEGLRVTTPEILKTARTVFLEANRTLCNALEDGGAEATPIDQSVFEAELLDFDNLGYVGQVINVHNKWVLDAVDNGKVPVVPPLGESLLGQTLNINADIAAVELAKSIQPNKVIYINDMGGLLNGDDKLIPNINYPSDYEWLLKQPWLRHGTKLKVKEIGQLLDHLPITSSVSVTSPQLLMKELFTHGGAGTLCRKETKVNRYNSLDDPRIDYDRVIEIMRIAFNGVMPSKAYLERLKKVTKRVYLCAHYTGFILLTDEPGCDVPYMDKFVVSKLAQGIGTGKALWLEVLEDCDQLFWRSRRSNQINSWYHNVSHGHYRRHGEKDWVIFYRGMHPGKDTEKLNTCIDVACNLESSWAEKEENLMADNLGSSNNNNNNNNNSSSASNKIQTAVRRNFSSISPKNTPVKVGLLGARGYVGVELLRLVADHPGFTLTHASSRSLIGKNVDAIVKQQAEEQGFDISEQGLVDLHGITFSNMSPDDCKNTDVDLWFLALPNGLAEPYVNALLSKDDVKMIDLSADYRFDDEWTYGIPEVNRELIKRASLISNPGCYATGAQLALLPLLNSNNDSGSVAPLIQSDSSPHVFGISGYSGAGTTPSPKNDVNLLKDNIMAYKLTGHIHEKEVSKHLNHHVNFMPHVASFFRGIHLTVNAVVDQEINSHKLRDIYENFYANEALVKIVDDPQVANNAGQHYVCIGNFTTGNSDGKNHVVVTATIDNLLKGAATQALQNANLAYGYDEFEGIDLV
jgi:N-acetyl-gamma-glutamyl-phosphate reductase / acetylglutamate kinase